MFHKKMKTKLKAGVTYQYKTIYIVLLACTDLYWTFNICLKQIITKFIL